MNTNRVCIQKMPDTKKSGMYVLSKDLIPPNMMVVNRVLVPTIVLGDSTHHLLPWLAEESLTTCLPVTR